YLYYLKNYYRSRSFYLMFFMAVVVSLLLTYLSFKYLNDLAKFATNLSFIISGPTSKERILAYLWSFVLSTFPAFAAVFFGSPSISSEIETKTALHVFTLPIPRIILLIGKFLSSVTVTSAIVLTYTIFEVIVFQYLFNVLIIELLYSFLLTLMFVLAFSSVTFLISSLFNKNTYAYITALITYLLVFNAATIIIELLYSVTPYYLLNNAASITSRVYINIFFGITLSGGNTSPAPFSLIAYTSIVMFLYFIISFGITAVIFERKEVK
ncbi:MAG: ABC transporter permease, partial [Candidatus Thermoplasmatota archaeon]|nr:ABC transporter permease [Candidatus Thermoplasmatota archaeon]MCL5988556.1 ABC transporter permease [Candidatus Thermoplasmatota archaeon]